MKIILVIIMVLAVIGCTNKAPVNDSDKYTEWREEYADKCIDAITERNEIAMEYYCVVENPERRKSSHSYDQRKYSGAQVKTKDEDLSFTCREAISRRNAGAIDVFCKDMDFMLRESIKQNNPGGIDVFGGKQDFMCREAIKNQDSGGIFIFCQ